MSPYARLPQVQTVLDPATMTQVKAAYRASGVYAAVVVVERRVRALASEHYPKTGRDALAMRSWVADVTEHNTAVVVDAARRGWLGPAPVEAVEAA